MSDKDYALNRQVVLCQNPRNEDEYITLTIHKTEISPPSRAVRIVARLLKLVYIIEEVNLSRKENCSEQFLEKNPLHTVPVLEDDDLIITDSHAINMYLVSKYGRDEQENLYPKDLRIRAMVDQRLYFEASVLYPRLKTVINMFLYGHGQELNTDQRSDIIECYELLERYLSKQPFLAADHITLADISCITTLSSMDCILPVHANYENLHKWWNRLKRESWYETLNQPGLLMFKGLIYHFLSKE